MTRSTDHRREFEDWKRRADEADLLEVATKYGAALKRAGREHVGPCPFCNGKDRFSVNVQRHKWNCRGHGGGHGAVSLAMHIGGLSFLEACEELTGEPNPAGQQSKPLTEEQKAARNRQRLESERRQQERQAQEKAYQEDTRESAQAIWGASIGLTDTLAEKYLNSRGIPTPDTGWPTALRFHPSLPYPGKPKPYPVLVCRVDDVMGNLTAVWRIFLREDGRKADVENAKLGLGPSAGGAVRLGGVAPHIGVAEGVESALGAWCLIGRNIPVWSALSTSGLVGLELPLGVSRVTIWPDGDRPLKRNGNEFIAAEPAGRKAAQALFARLTEEGTRASIAAEPSAGKDYCDIWNDEQMRETA